MRTLKSQPSASRQTSYTTELVQPFDHVFLIGIFQCRYILLYSKFHATECIGSLLMHAHNTLFFFFLLGILLSILNVPRVKKIILQSCVIWREFTRLARILVIRIYSPRRELHAVVNVHSCIQSAQPGAASQPWTTGAGPLG